MTLTARAAGRAPAAGDQVVEPSVPPGPPGPAEHRLRALDGIRAFAVLAVLLYHGGLSWVGGGLLGVDVFFVLSGYLITTLLCREYVASQVIRLGRFWAARARRLLPALILLLLGVAVYASVLSAAQSTPTIRGDALSTLFYFANWHFVVSQQGYFVQSGAPSPLLHTWSLSVEEQYYIVWPLIALFVLRRWGRRRLAAVAAVGAIASALLMLVLYASGASVDRLYYGTDTRAQALLVGSALGALSARRGWRLFDAHWARTRHGRTVGAMLAVVGAAWLLWAWHDLQGQTAFLYRGGFLLVALAAAAVITVVTCWPEGRLGRLCSWLPLVALGRISYGVYLYHWPIFLALDHSRTGLTGVALLVPRLVATLVVSVLSFRFVEEPVRRRVWSFRRPGGGGRRRAPRPRLPGWAEGAIAGGAVVVTSAVLVVATEAPAPAVLTSSSRLAAEARAALPAPEVSALQASHAFGADPIRFLFLGDSEALTATVGLRAHAVRDYGVKVIGGSWLGCDIDAALPIMEQGVPGTASGICANWRTLWPTLVHQHRAEVVGVLLGRFELLDHQWHGRWAHLGQPAWDQHVTAELTDAVRLLSAQGAKVALFTAPYINPPTEAPDGQPYPENQPSRVRAFNRIVSEVASRFPGTAAVVPLGRILDPDGHFQQVVDGVPVRWADGIHISRAGGEWLQAKILPTIAQLGLDARASPPVSPR